ncbi:hypothetical protein DRN67_02650, partial [Candidatus Micrarchaeota archaeon]
IMPEERITLYLAESEGKTWRVIEELGTFDESSEVRIGINVTYKGSSEEIKNYMLLAQAKGEIKGKGFSVLVDWSSYEEKVRQSIVKVNVLLIPLLGMGIVILLVVLFEFALIRKDEGGLIPGEYTTASLFFPLVKRRPFGEMLADLFINPIFMIFELVLIGLFATVMLNYGISLYGSSIGAKMFLLTGIGALSIPVIYMAMAWLADVYEREPLRFIFSAFVWGIFSALLAFALNSIVSNLLGIYLSQQDAALITATTFIGTAVIAPVLEEFTKGIGVLVLAGHHELDDMLDGLLYGFVIGVGFSVLENWFYFMARANPFELGLVGWVDFITYRLLFNSMAHGAFTATCGAFIGYFKSQPHLARYSRLAFLPGLFMAIALHSLFNVSSIIDELVIYALRIPIFGFNPVMVGVLAIAFIGVFYYATLQTRHRLNRGVRAAVEEWAEFQKP